VYVGRILPITEEEKLSAATAIARAPFASALATDSFASAWLEP